MPDNTVKSISFEKYFSLLRDVLPVTVDLYACDAAGCLIATDDNNTPGSNIIESKSLPGWSCMSGESLPARIDSNRLVMPVFNALDEPVAHLVAVQSDSAASPADSSDDLVYRSFRNVASCIEQEYRLTAELDAMAEELAGRYEELNLVYETTDDITDFGNEGRTLTSLLEKYIEHLDVDMVALSFPAQERIFSATNDSDPIPEAYDIIHNLGKACAKQTGSSDTFLLVNGFTDPKRDEYRLNVPCKIMACPVLNSRGAVNGLLVCINHIQRRDFYNSDKNLLQVMSKKVSKIVQSNYDVLTGLINRQAFENVIQDAINRSRTRGLFHCVLNIDLDKLKVINESFGREAGDRTITMVADLLHDSLRQVDIVSYLGEGRYGVLLEQCHMEEGIQISESLRKLIDDTIFTWKSRPVDTSITIGIAVIEPHTHNLDDVLEAVEIARDAAKESGDRHIQLYRHNDDDLVMRKEHLHWVSRIQQALRNDEFSIYCQTICPATPASEDWHFEVLLRMVDTDGSIIAPAKFIPPAERFNLMPIIDRWVIDKTLSLLSAAGIARNPGEGVVSINLSGQSLANQDLVNYIIDIIDKYGLSPDCICFEITETSAIRDTESSQAIFNQLKSRGCKLSLDDFGTGLSSFSYLKNIPVDYLKIDGSFVRTILNDTVAHAMVASINNVGHVMRLKTIAEYVESDALARQLKLIGVDYLQGYAIAKPVDLKDYLSGLRSSASARTG